MVKIFKYLIAILILTTLVSSLGAEVFGKSTHLNSCTSNFESNSEQGCASHDEIASSLSADHSHHGAKCADPCHVGKSHFGHCSYMMATAGLSFIQSALASLQSYWSQSAIVAPDLDGLRRPPKLA